MPKSVMQFANPPVLVLTSDFRPYGASLDASFRFVQYKRYDSDPERALVTYNDRYADQSEKYTLEYLQMRSWLEIQNGVARNYGTCFPVYSFPAEVTAELAGRMARTLDVITKGFNRFSAAGMYADDFAMRCAQLAEIVGAGTYAYVPTSARYPEWLVSGFKIDNLSTIRWTVNNIVKQYADKEGASVA
jgi:hypothetical protein